MASQVLFSAYFLLFFIVCILKFRSRDFLEVTPSLFWNFLVVLPFWFQRDPSVHPEYETQIWGILGIGFFLLVGDAIEGRRVALVEKLPQAGFVLLAQSALIMMGGLQVIHMGLLEGDLQLVHWIVEGGFRAAWVNPHPWLQVFLLVGTPVALALLLRGQRLGLAMFFFAFSIFYGFNLSLEYGVLFTAIGLLLFGTELTHFVSRIIWAVLIAVTLVPLGIFYTSLSSRDLSALSSNATSEEKKHLVEHGFFKTDGVASLTQGDEYRLLKQTSRYDRDTTGGEKVFNDALYETLLVPSEAGLRWYQYFSVPGNDRPEYYSWLAMALEKPELLNPANQVGTWALTRRFPQAYDESVYMWAPADADGWVRFGGWGVVFTVFIVLVSRMLIKYMRIRSFWGQSLNLCSLFFLGYGIAHASLPAVFVRYGVAFFLLLMYFYFLYCRKYIQQDYLPSHRQFE